MSITPVLHETLQITARMMRAARDDWWVISGAAAALYEPRCPEPQDVDVLVSVRDANALLDEFGAASVRPGPDVLFSSAVLGRLTSAPLPIEIMAELRYRTASGWHAATPQSREAVEVGGSVLFIPSRADLISILVGFGRPKDIRRASLLRGD